MITRAVPIPVPITPVALATAAEAFDVSRTYGDKLALDGASLKVHEGELIGLLGPNGAGKSTIINLFTGMRRPSKGRVEIFGGDPREPKTRRHMGVTPQEAGLPENLKVGEVVDFVGAHFPDATGRDELLERFGLADLTDRKTGGLSGGQKRRLTVALAFVGNPRIVFLDEPTTGLDVEARRNLWGQIADFHTAGGTVVLTSHYLEEIEALAKRVIVMSGGKIVADDTLQAIRGSSPSARSAWTLHMYRLLRTSPGKNARVSASRSTPPTRTSSCATSCKAEHPSRGWRFGRPASKKPSSPSPETTLVFAVMSSNLFGFGIGVAEDRSKPWDPFTRTLPIGATPRFAGRFLTGLVMMFLSLIPLLVVAALFTEATITPLQLLSAIGVLVLAALPFILMGLAIGYSLPSKAALVVVQILFMPMAFAGGLFVPLDKAPGFVQTIGPYMPTRGAGELMYATVGDFSVNSTSMISFAVWTVALGALAIRGYRRDEGVRYH